MATAVNDFPAAVFGLDSGFFHLPGAQARAWGVPEEQIDRLRVLLAIGHFHFAFHDLVIDEGRAPAAMCVLADVSLLRYLDGLAELAPGSADRYRALHDRYYRAYAAAMARDLGHRGEARPYTTDEISGLGDKAAPGMTALHVVADLAGMPARGEPAAQALLRLCTGLQLLDDLKDAAEDATNGVMSWPLTCALLAYPDVDLTDERDLRAALVGSGAASACLNVAGAAFVDAARLADATDATVVADLARTWSSRAAEQQSDLLLPVDLR
ncbi:hypothetical protein KUTG_02376 [Kutzneria sp. 744]|nr:hypothetical protein KUTG_02376 [Kutzneria sp. 744]